MPSGKTGVTRAEAKSQCLASGFWLPDMFVRSDFNLAQTSALFGNSQISIERSVVECFQIDLIQMYLLPNVSD